MSQTILYPKHLEANAKIVDFAGWDMPIHYGSQLDEHHQVRCDAGMFDVSHMVVVDLEGVQVRAYLQKLLANDVAKLKTAGKALYSCMLNENGGVIDDLITYYLNEQHFRMVVNAATRDKDVAWLKQQATAFSVTVTEHPELAMIAVQGPNARVKAQQALGSAGDEAATLKPFVGKFIGDYFVARTGYTGEDGFEIMLPEAEAGKFWDNLLAAGVKPCGLGARDTLRIEAGMNLYGTDMDESTSPLVSGLNWTVSLKDSERDFIGRSTLEADQAKGELDRFVGLVLQAKGVLRGGQVVHCANGTGVITSGSFSPTLQQSIAMARIPAGSDDQVQVEIRGKQFPASVVKMPFVRNGESQL